MALHDFYYKKLEKAQQRAYCVLKEGLLLHKKRIKIKYIPNIHCALYALKNDYGAELYYVNWLNIEQNILFDVGQNKIIFIPRYLFTVDEVSLYNAKIKGILSKFSKVKDKSLLCRKVHDWITLNSVYDDDEVKKGKYRFNNHNIIGPIIEHKSVCEGFAKAYQFILNKFGIDSMTVSGRVMRTEKEYYRDYHAWNVVKLNGKRYNVDITWDKPIELNEKKYPTYGYYCLPNKMFEDHISGLCLHCDSMDENLFYKAGRLYSSVKELKTFLAKPNKYDISFIYVLGLSDDIVSRVIHRFGRYNYKVIRTSDWEKGSMLVLIK